MITLEMLQESAAHSAPSRLALQYLVWSFHKPAYADWCTSVEDALFHALSEICQRRNDFHDLDEDALTGIVIVALKTLDLDASGKVVNGNSDLAVAREDYLWLGEAKIAGPTSKIWGGYLQLTQRYATGQPNQTRGGMLIFCRDESTNMVMAGWRAALTDAVAASDAKDHLTSPFAFTSSDTAPATGLPLEIVHIAFPLYHQPLDPTATLPPAAAEASRLAKVAAKANDASK